MREQKKARVTNYGKFQEEFDDDRFLKSLEAKKSVEGFAKTGKVKAFVCGAAQMLDEKTKTKVKYEIESFTDCYKDIYEDAKDICEDVKDNDKLKQQVIGGATMAAGLIAGAVATEVVAIPIIIAGGALCADSILSISRDKPALIERLKDAPKNIENFANKFMKKGGR